MIQHVEIVAGGVGNDAEGIDALGEEGLLGGKNAVAADRELGDVGVRQGSAVVQIDAAFGIDAPVQHIKKPPAGERTARPGLAPPEETGSPLMWISLPVL